jgi:hypothetical protein
MVISRRAILNKQLEVISGRILGNYSGPGAVGSAVLLLGKRPRNKERKMGAG